MKYSGYRGFISLLVVLIMTLCSCGFNTSGGEYHNSKTTMVRVDGSQAQTPVPSKADYEMCTKYIDELYSVIGEYDDRGYKEPGDIAAALYAVYELAVKWSDNGEVSTLSKHENYIYLEFKSGISHVFYPAYDNISAPKKDTNVEIYSLQVFKTEFAQRGEDTRQVDEAATDYSAKKIDDTFDNYYWKYDLDDKDVTVAEVANFGANEVILWSGHGVYLEEFGPVLCLSETIYDQVYEGDACYSFINDGAYIITPEFIDLYVKDLSNTFIYLSTCEGLKDDRLVEAFSKKNAEAIVANTETITTIYTSQIMAAVIDSMVSGNNLGTAMDEAKVQYGEHDSYIYSEFGATDYSVPTVYIGDHFKFGETFKPDILPDDTYMADIDYTAKLSKDLKLLTIESGFSVVKGSNIDDIQIVPAHERKKYFLPISDKCVVDDYEMDVIMEPLKNAQDFVTRFFNNRNGILCYITIKNGEVVMIRFSA